MSGPHLHDDDHDDHGGFARDVPYLVGRRHALALLGGLGLTGALAACGQSGGDGSNASGSSTSASSTSTSAAAVAASAGAAIPQETEGPYPADGTNGPNILTDGAIVRSDITTSVGDLSGTADGVPLTLNLTIVDAANGSALPGAALYLWHCTADGRYSIYEESDQNYLRGVQVADDNGRVSFTSVFPGCYAGRWPHAHFEVFDSLDVATAGSAARRTSQLALPEGDCTAVYADSRYGSSADDMSRLSLDTDGIFRDGWTDQLATMSGSVDEGYAASLLVRV
jgi:protocatechuate 3,4-dioxygenase beta subunit